MNELEIVKNKLYETQASLVVLYSNEQCQEYYQNRITDIKEILQENKNALKDAIVADKVIGKVAGSILACAGVKAIYADTMSKYAIPVLEETGVKYEYSKLVDYIKNIERNDMCPMEKKYKDEKDIQKIYNDIIN